MVKVKENFATDLTMYHTMILVFKLTFYLTVLTELNFILHFVSKSQVLPILQEWINFSKIVYEVTFC